MIEVFRTNLEDREHAIVLIDQIHEKFPYYRANFDLDDCDRILRIESKTGDIDPSNLIQLLNDYGYEAEILEDAIVPYRK